MSEQTKARYEGRIKVVCPDRMCFPVDARTLEPLGTSVYDAYAFTSPDPEPMETIDFSEWNRRRTNTKETP